MKKCKLFIITLFASISVSNSYAQKIDTVFVYSPKMNKKIENVIITPKSYYETDSIKYPVLYLLHGFGGVASSWSSDKKNLEELASRYNMIIISPYGENSWYWDSPVLLESQFETFMTKELVEYIDENYKTNPSPKARAITGLSMGGHGGLWLGLNHPDVYGACGSMSGGVDFRPFPNNWNVKYLLGEFAKNEQRWNDHVVMELVDRIKPAITSAIIIDCGVDDFFYEVNEKLHKKLLANKIKHDYIVRPGGHTWEYWNNSVDFQLLFFSKFFDKN